MCLEMVGHFIEHVRCVETLANLHSTLDSVARELGFHHFALIHHTDLRYPSRYNIHLDNYPDEWRHHFVQKQLYRIDPILALSARSTVGFSWTDVPEILELSDCQRGILENSAKHGLGEGYTIPANIPFEPPGSCSFATRMGTDYPKANLLPANLIGAFAFQAARRIVGLDLQLRHGHRELTARQKECLLWAIRGKTDWEIGQILKLNEETVSQHLNMARARYSVTKRLPLAIHAIYDGQINIFEAIDGQFPPKRE